MKGKKPTPFPHLAVIITGPTNDQIQQAAAMFSKTPEQYCLDYLYWLAAMDLEGGK